MSTRSTMVVTWIALASAQALAGCSLGLPSVPDLSGLYDRAAQADDSYRNPVIVIPGIIGTKLVDPDSGRIVWGAFAGQYADPEDEEGARLIALPMQEGASLRDLRDDVEPDGVLDSVRVSLLGLPLEQQAYLHILSTLGVGGYRDQDLGRLGSVRYAQDHFTCFQFDYDWRRDNAENAQRLDQFIREKKAYVTAELEKRHGKLEREVKFDVIAHSMGGLLLRYYLRYGATPLPDDGSLPPITWAGAESVDRAILVATPNAGSAHALADLVDGIQLSFILPKYPSGVLGTMPSIYQLLPRTRHRAVLDTADPDGPPIDVLDAQVWQEFGWGLASPDQDEMLADLLPETDDAAERRRIARDHLAKVLARARQFHAALDAPASPPRGLSIHLYAGDAETTPAVAAVDRETGALRFAQHGPGDGTVLRTSALMDERVGSSWQPGLMTPIRWSSVTFVHGDHLALTRDPTFTDNILFRLLESPRQAEIPQPATTPAG